MAIFLIDLPPNEMERRLSDALSVYVDAMRYPRGTVNQRAAMWLEHIRRRGWQGVAAVETPNGAPKEEPKKEDVPSSVELSDAPLLGVAYGYPGAPGQWWQQQVVLGLQRGGSPPEEISLGYGWWVALLGGLLILTGSIARTRESGARRKPPGVL